MTHSYQRGRDSVEHRDSVIRQTIETFHGTSGDSEAEVTWVLPKGEDPRMYGTTSAVARLLKRVNPDSIVSIRSDGVGATIRLDPSAVRSPELMAKAS